MLLAAGRASRFGGEKLLAPLSGRPVAAHAADALGVAVERGLLAARVAVVRDLTSPLAARLRESGLELVESPEADRGLAYSLRAGVAAVERQADDGPAAILVVLADQPDTSDTIIAALVEAWRVSGADAVRPRYSEAPDEPGHPVLLDRRVWPLVHELEGDAGLGAVLQHGPLRVELVPVTGRNPGIDTRAELAARQSHQESTRCD